MDKPPKNEKHDTIDGVSNYPSIDNSEAALTSEMNKQYKDSLISDIPFKQKGEAHKDSTESTPKR